MNLTRMKRPGLLAGAIVLPVVMVVVLGVLSSAVVAGPEDVAATGKTVVEQPERAVPVAAQSASAQEGFVLRFDPVQESFETFRVPTDGANPHSLDVVSNGTSRDVWFTEPGADKIGRLVYTATNDYAVYEYAVTAGGEPLNLAVDGERGVVWFTERAGNRIGRLEIGSGSSATYSGFAVPMANSRPSGIDLAPDGSVWFSEMAADQIGHLVVTSTSDFDMAEYEIPQFTGLPSESAPYGIYVENPDRIWFAETARDQLVRFQPSTYPFDKKAAFVGAGRPGESGGYLYNLTYNPTNSLLWVTELVGNRVTFYYPGTLPGLQYPVPTANSRPYDLAVDSTGTLWFSEQRGGKLGMLVRAGAGAGYTITQEYAVPLANARPEGVAVDSQDKVWLAASSWQKVYLPLVGKNFPPAPPLFGIQTYWPIDGTHGLPEMADADAEWVRLMLNWVSVEPSDTTPENFNWTMFDGWFGNLHAAGIRPVVTIQGNPSWAARYGGGPVYAEHMEDLLEFVGALVERYDGDGIDDAPGSPVVNHWELYNEPDNGSVLLAEHGYGYWGHNGAGYADLLRRVGPVIKAANPKAQVLNGGIAYERFEDAGEGPYVRRFVDDFLAAGGGQYIDIFNFHYYPTFANRWAPYGPGVIGKTTFLRDRLRSYGVAVPLACTEIGTHSDPSLGGSNESQSRYVVQAFVRSMAADLRIVTWFALRDIVEGFPYAYGLLDVYFQPKPAYDAFDVLTEQLSGASFRRRLGANETGTSAIEGYVLSQGERNVYVVWANDAGTYTMEVPTPALERVDKLGASQMVLDAADGVTDGVVRVAVGPSPVYLKFEP
jgi:streptogramin lyase